MFERDNSTFTWHRSGHAYLPRHTWHQHRYRVHEQELKSKQVSSLWLSCYSSARPTSQLTDKSSANTGGAIFELPPGQHTIEICFRYCFLSQCGLNTMTINLAPGDVAKISYWMPPWIFAKGSMKLWLFVRRGVGSVVEPSTTNSKLAIWSLVLGILGFAGLAALTTVLRLLCGHLAYSKLKIRRCPDR